MARRTTGHLYLRGSTYWVKYTVNGNVVRESLGTGNARTAKALLAEKLAPVSAGDAAKKARALALGAADLETRLAEAKDAVARSLAKLRASEPVELAAADLREALDAIGRITGRIDNEQMLDRLFAKFCIGK